MSSLAKRIYLSPPHFTGEEMNYLRDTFGSNLEVVLGDSHVKAFEQELGARLGVPHVLAVSSGTSAIQLGLQVLGVKPGDVVICSRFTFSPSANPIVNCGVIPLPIYNDISTYGIDPSNIEEAARNNWYRNNRPKAIVLSHMLGMPASIGPIIEIANNLHIPVIEDAAQALGSTYDGKPVGTFGKLGVVSFDRDKIITATAGGALFSFDEALIEEARYLTKETKEPIGYYEHNSPPSHCRLSNLLAAIGRSQLKVLDDRVARRRAIYSYYKSAINIRGGAIFHGDPRPSPIDDDIRAELARGNSNRWLTSFIFSHPSVTSELLVNALANANIESRPVWPPGSYSDWLGNICLPSGSNMTEEDLKRVVDVINKTLQ